MERIERNFFALRKCPDQMHIKTKLCLNSAQHFDKTQCDLRARVMLSLSKHWVSKSLRLCWSPDQQIIYSPYPSLLVRGPTRASNFILFVTISPDWLLLPARLLFLLCMLSPKTERQLKCSMLNFLRPHLL